jgi:hypothetical protein
MTEIPVGHVSLQATDGDGSAFLAQGTNLLALGFLRADPAAYAGQGILALEDIDGFFHVVLADGLNELRDIDVNRATGDTGALGTLYATGGFLLGHFLGITECYFVIVVCSYLRVLTRHFDPVKI